MFRSVEEINTCIYNLEKKVLLLIEQLHIKHDTVLRTSLDCAILDMGKLIELRNMEKWKTNNDSPKNGRKTVEYAS